MVQQRLTFQLWSWAKRRAANFPEDWQFLKRKFRSPSLDERPTRAGNFLHPWIETDIAEARQEKFGTKRLWTTSPTPVELSQERSQYFISEMSALRTEILDIKKREAQTEALAITLIAAAYFAVFSETINLPRFVEIVTGFIPILTTAIGYMRFKEDQRNIFEIDCYLMEIERLFHKEGGWVNYFFLNRDMDRYFFSRTLIWSLVGLVVLFGTVLIAWLLAVDLVAFIVGLVRES